MSKKHKNRKMPEQLPPVIEIRIQSEEEALEYLLKYLCDQKGYSGRITVSQKLGQSVWALRKKWGFTIRNPQTGGVETFEVFTDGVVWQTYPMRK